MKINRDNLKWLGRLELLIVLTALAEGLVVAFAQKPFPWVVLIPALLPLFTTVFIVIPKIRADRQALPSA